MYHRFMILANPTMGSASFSWRAKCALENLGHTVFWFTPRTHSFLFGGANGAPDLLALSQFVARQKPDCLLVADGLSLDVKQLAQLKSLNEGMLVGCLAEREEACFGDGLAAADVDSSFDFVVAGGKSLADCLVAKGLRNVFACELRVDASYARTPIANTIAKKPCILCVQDATPERVEALRDATAAAKEGGLDLCFVGHGWPSAWKADLSAWNSFVYASRAAAALFVLEDGQSAPDANLLSLALVDGAPVVRLGGDSSELSQTAKQTVLNILAQGAPSEARRFAANALAEGAPTLETEFAGILATLEDSADGCAALAGNAEPRTVVTILGYFGMGNFGDEYILATLDERVRAEISGSSVIAVSENPQHTLVKRGIYATSLEKPCEVDSALSYSSAALVVAGLLFDQGIRWTAGKAEAFTSTRCPDIPGIAAFASMAALNDTPMVFHGIGAGPLDVLDARQLVKLVGKQGAVFTPRDKETGDIIRACGVNPDQVFDCADTIFLESASQLDGEAPETASKTIAVSLREYENTPVDFPERMAQALDIVAEAHTDAGFTFCILDPGDLKLSQRVIALMEHGDRCCTFDHEEDLAALTDFLKSCSAGFSMRYHSALVMNSFGIPCAGMDYLPKVTSLYSDLGLSEILVPPTATTQQCATALLSAIENGATWRSVLVERQAPLRERSQKALDILLSQIESVRSVKAGSVPHEFFLYSQPSIHRKVERLTKEAAKAKKDSKKGDKKKSSSESAASKSALTPGAAAIGASSSSDEASGAEQPLVSIVMPVYNAAKHLAECVDSLLGQTYANIELICVDDGSKDESLTILHDYALRDPRVRVFSQPNAGPGVARNKGMDEARGEFIYFFDSDDFCDPALVEAAVSRFAATGADLVSFAFKEYDDRVKKICDVSWAETPASKFPCDPMHWSDSPDWAFQAFHNYPWNKMARLSFVRENGIRFQEMYLTEDLMYALPAVLCAERMSFVSGQYVYHRVGTATNSMSGKDSHPLDFIEALRALKAYLDERGIYEDLRVSYANWAVECCKYNLHTLKTFEGFQLVFDTLAGGVMAELGLDDVDPSILLFDSYRVMLDALKTMSAQEYSYRLYAGTLYSYELLAFKSKVDAREKKAALKKLEAEHGKTTKLMKSAE